MPYNLVCVCVCACIIVPMLGHGWCQGRMDKLEVPVGSKDCSHWGTLQKDLSS